MFLKTIGYGPLERATPVSQPRGAHTPGSRTSGRARRSLAFDIDSPSSENLDELKGLLAANFPSSLASAPYRKLSDVKLATRTLYEGAPIDTAEKSDAILQKLTSEKNRRLMTSCGKGHQHWCTSCYEEKAVQAKEQLARKEQLGPKALLGLKALLEHKGLKEQLALKGLLVHMVF